MTEFPSLVAKLTHVFGAWIIGSAAEPGIELSSVRDFDVVVPLEQWYLAAALIPMTALSNTYGGWKVETETGVSVDIWPDDIGRLLLNSKCTIAWHPKSGIRIKKGV